MLDCLVNIVGITNTDCDCLVAGLSPEIKAKLKLTTTGLYIDSIADALNFKVLKTLDACKTFADWALEARDNAINEFYDSVTVAISHLYKKSASVYKGNIARATYAKTMVDNKQFQGVIMKTNNHSDGTMKINRIQIIGNAVQEMQLVVNRRLQNSLEFEDIGRYPFTTQVNNFVVIPTVEGGLTLPLGKDMMPYEYRFYYDRGLASEFYPKDTPIGCGCAASVNDVLTDYVITEGISFLEEPGLNYSSDSYSHGLVFDVTIDCKTEVLFCRELTQSEDIMIAAKYAVAYRANEYLIEKVQASQEINRFTMQNSNYLWGKRSHFRKEFETRVEFIAGRININNSDCFACRPTTMFKGKIRS